MSNILKKELDCTCEDFLAKVYGNRSKPFTNAVKSLFVSVLTRNSMLVKDLSASARKSAGFAFSERNVKDRKIDVATFVFSGI